MYNNTITWNIQSSFLIFESKLITFVREHMKSEVGRQSFCISL